MATTETTPSFGDQAQNFFFDALRSKYVTNDRQSDVERVSDDKNIPDRVDAQYGIKPTSGGASFGLMQNKGTLALVSILSVGGLYLLLKGKK